MWGWRKPALPLDLREKVWTELSMSWLAEQFGRDRLLAAPTVTPTAEFFPEPLDASDLNVQRAFDRVCYYMGVEPGEVSLELVEETNLVADEPTDPHVRVAAPSKRDAVPFIADSAKGIARYKPGRLPSAAALCALHDDPAALVTRERGADEDESWDQVLTLVRAVENDGAPATELEENKDEESPSPRWIGDYGLLPLLVPSRERAVPARWSFA